VGNEKIVNYVKTVRFTNQGYHFKGLVSS
jgi:hypothetical protein